MKSAKRNGIEITTGEAGTYKAIQDGVSVDTLLLDDLTPSGLCLTFNWPVSLPKEKIDFVLISYNDGHSFMGAFRYGTFGLDMAYSENSHPDLIKSLAITGMVTIKEISEDNQREYECELKHAVDHDSSIVIDLIESDVAQFENAPKTPFNEGFTGYFQGVENNPHNAGGKDFNEWANGRKDAIKAEQVNDALNQDELLN